MTQEFHQERRLGPNRNYVTPVEQFRGADFATGSLLSGGVSGVLASVVLRSVSGNERLRMVNVDLYHQDTTGWLLVEIRDGGVAGGTRIAGPWLVNAQGERHIPPEELIGRYATSSITLVAISGGVASPLSTGLLSKVSYFAEPTDLPGERTS